MTKPDITPGPWDKGTSGMHAQYISAAGTPICGVLYGKREEADTKAIAAVPSMLSALEKAHRDLVKAVQGEPVMVNTTLSVVREALIESGYTF